MSERGLTESGGVRSADGPLYADEGQEEADDVDGQRQSRGHQEDVDVLHPAAQRRAVPHLRSASVKTEQLKSCSNRPTTNNLLRALARDTETKNCLKQRVSHPVWLIRQNSRTRKRETTQHHTAKLTNKTPNMARAFRPTMHRGTEREKAVNSFKNDIIKNAERPSELSHARSLLNYINFFYYVYQAVLLTVDC